MTDRLWVLGAADPEMEAIESLLKECGVAFAYAAVDGQRVHPGNAYRATGAITPDGEFRDAFYGTQLIFVECDIFSLRADHEPRPVVVDHHRPGDPGHGKPAKDFLPASSIGQIIARLAGLGLLNWEADLSHADDQGHSYVEFFRPFDYMTPAEWRDKDIGDNAPTWIVSRHPGDDQDINYFVPRNLVFVAAADHCLAAAYRGECPGVDPDELMRWRVKSRASHQGRTEEQLLSEIQQARKILRDAVAAPPSWAVDPDPSSDWPGIHPDDAGPRPYADLRKLCVAHVPELPEAACREGIPYLATVRERDGREKVVLGAASPELVERFLRGELVPGLVERYGDPARGFAGGYPAASAVRNKGA